MGKRYVKNGQKVNKHGIPIGIRDIEEVVDEAERKEQKKEIKVEEPKKEYRRKEFLETIIVKPDPNYRKEFKQNKENREKSEQIEAQKMKEELAKARAGIKEKETIENEQNERIEILKEIEEKRKGEER